MRAGFRGAALYIEVTDNGEGITQKRLDEIASGNYTSGRMHHGIGLKNVQKRLEIIYGGNSGVRVKSHLGEYTTVSCAGTLPQGGNAANVCGDSRQARRGFAGAGKRD
nr:ATP-binding protein [uncultured Agathobaculum sp.]